MKDQIVERFKNELPAEVSEKAIANFEKEFELSKGIGISKDLTVLAKIKTHSLLDAAFVWSETPEGNAYWNSVFLDLVDSNK